MEDLKKEITELKLIIQQLEERITNLEKGEFGSGVYLEGCTDADKEYIKPVIEGKKEGE